MHTAAIISEEGVLLPKFPACCEERYKRLNELEDPTFDDRLFFLFLSFDFGGVANKAADIWSPCIFFSAKKFGYGRSTATITRLDES